MLIICICCIKPTLLFKRIRFIIGICPVCFESFYFSKVRSIGCYSKCEGMSDFIINFLSCF